MSETHAMKQERKRAEAEARQEAYDGLTTKQKLQHLDWGKFRAVKQRARLMKQLEAEGNAEAEVEG